MTKLPIAICLFTSTKGHFGHSTYADTLRHLDRQIPLSQFGARYAHIKVTPGQEDVGIAMELALMERDFGVDATVGDWSRGASHQQAYLLDQRKASQSRVVQSQPYVMLLEDDSTLSPAKGELADYLARMMGALDREPDLVSTRLVRRCDWDGGIPTIGPVTSTFFSPNFDMQPSILRSRDFMLAHKVIEDNWGQLSHLQCELVLRIALDTLSRSPNRHMVWHPDEIESHHLGTPDYPALKAALNL